MERTLNYNPNTNVELAGSLVQRYLMASGLGMSYNGNRDIYDALGYKKILEWKDFWNQYRRQDIAKAIINRPVNATWRGDLKIVETKDDKDTPFEKAWDDLNKAFKLKNVMSRVDKLTGLGKYGVLFLGLSDAKTKEDQAQPVQIGNLKLVYARPFSEVSAEVVEWVTDSTRGDYGKPLIYLMRVQGANNMTESQVRVHASRVIHIIDEPLESEIEGTPRLEVVFNRLMDLEKIVGGDAETFWRNARPGYFGKIEDEFTMTPSAKEDTKNQLNEFEHYLRRFLLLKGVDVQSLSQAIFDPSSHVDIQIQMISAVTEIPKRILTGSERGELSSAQDSDEWKDYTQNRREEQAEPWIVRPFVDRLIAYKILPIPKTGTYEVMWSDLYAKSDKDKSEIGAKRALALKDYTSSPLASEVIPPEAFLNYFLGLDEDTINIITEMKKAFTDQEQNDFNPEPGPVEEPEPEPEFEPVP